MRQHRSVSQILFGFLPEQTVDLAGGIWKVAEWRSPRRRALDANSLKRELLRASAPWSKAGRDEGLARALRQGREVAVYSLDNKNGVSVEPFPRLWMCRTCNRLYQTRKPSRCRCGQERLGQLPFVGYHDCGKLITPFIRKCAAHPRGDVLVFLPTSVSAAEIVFRCGECRVEIQRGFGFSKCSCGAGNLSFNVHRASSVFTPRTVVIVNPPSNDALRRLTDGGGPARALAWTMDDLKAKSFDDVASTPEGMLSELKAQGLSETFAKKIVEQAIAAGEVSKPRDPIALPPNREEEVTTEAVTIAMALAQSRVTLQDLVESAVADRSDHRREIYERDYPRALERAGLQAIDLVDRFPVMTASFGYTRGNPSPGESTLIAHRTGANYAVYADIVETEALFVRLSPIRVAAWLERQGHRLQPWSDDPSARLAILRSAEIPQIGESSDSGAGAAILSLVHSFAHRFIRRAAVFAGIDRNALSELVVPHHLAFFVYATGRGDFVLGGLQAVFESELHNLLSEVAYGDHRCALDPGCQRAGGACVACMHLGEPSCRFYNQHLDRRMLFGPEGYLRSTNAPQS